MNETEKLASIYLEDRKRRSKNPVVDGISGTITGGSIGFLIPALSTSAAPKKIDKFIKNKKPFGKDLSNQLINDDANDLFYEKAKNENFNLSNEKRILLEKEALAESKAGLRKNPLNQNLAAQTGIGKVGALIGAGIGLTNSLKNRQNKKEEKGKIRKIIGDNKK